MRRRTLRLTIAACLLILAGVATQLLQGSSGSSASHKPESQRTPKQAHTLASDARLARRLSLGMGDRTPGEISTVKTTREKALRVISPEEEVIGGAPSDTPVQLFALHGKFTDPRSAPPGAASPTGRWLTVSVDLATGQILDLSLTDERPNLSTLGSIKHIKLAQRTPSPSPKEPVMASS
jgi:hypothetical protein